MYASLRYWYIATVLTPRRRAEYVVSVTPNCPMKLHPKWCELPVLWHKCPISLPAPDSLFAPQACDYLVIRSSKIQGTYLNMLTAKVRLHAINAIIRIPQRALTLLQIIGLAPFAVCVQLPSFSVRAAKASARLADSKMIKNRSKRTRRIFAFGDRRPNGLPVYSSQVMYRM